MLILKSRLPKTLWPSWRRSPRYMQTISSLSCKAGEMMGKSWILCETFIERWFGCTEIGPSRSATAMRRFCSLTCSIALKDQESMNSYAALLMIMRRRIISKCRLWAMAGNLRGSLRRKKRKMLRERGWASFTDRESGKIIAECSTFNCGHCNAIRHIQPGLLLRRGPRNHDWSTCKCCMELVCEKPECNNVCIPFMKKIEAWEGRNYALRSYGITVPF